MAAEASRHVGGGVEFGGLAFCDRKAVGGEDHERECGAEAVLRQDSQWHMPLESGSPSTRYLTAPHRHPPSRMRHLFCG